MFKRNHLTIKGLVTNQKLRFQTLNCTSFIYSLPVGDTQFIKKNITPPPPERNKQTKKTYNKLKKKTPKTENKKSSNKRIKEYNKNKTKNPSSFHILVRYSRCCYQDLSIFV